MSVSRVLVALGLCFCLPACVSQDGGPSSDPPAAIQITPHSQGAGRETFMLWCSGCHAAGRENPGSMRLEITRGRERSVLLERDDLHPEYVKVVVRQGYMSMPPFKSTDIPDEALEDLARFVASAVEHRKGAP